MSEAITPERSVEEQGGRIELPPTLFLQRQLLFNRELSWLEFNRRVLEEGEDAALPLLERLNFLSIFSTNLDEFFMIRVSGLKQQVDADVTELSPDGMAPSLQLKEISEKLRPMIARQMRCLNEQVLPALFNQGIVVAPFRALSDREWRSLNSYFMENVFPVLTPLAVDPSHPFPYISSLSLNLGVMVGPPAAGGDSQAPPPDAPRFARIKIPPVVRRLVPVSPSAGEDVLLGALLAANIATLFPGTSVSESHAFRVTRDADLEISEAEANDLLHSIESQLQKRRFGQCVRLEVASTMPGEMVRYLAGSMGLSAADVYPVEGMLNGSGLMGLYKLDHPELKFRPISRKTPSALAIGESIFEVLKQQDVLVHHPYDSFSAIVDFVNAAAADPDVLAIKTTLYRTGHKSPIVRALMAACESGQQVTALVELKARFDEENNITWARQL